MSAEVKSLRFFPRPNNPRVRVPPTRKRNAGDELQRCQIEILENSPALRIREYAPAFALLKSSSSTAFQALDTGKMPVLPLQDRSDR
jgi:hypothetical protein